MPELPEVETVRRQLEKRLVGARFSDVIIWQSDKERPQGHAFVDAILGKDVQAIDRRGKLLLIRFTDGSALAIHLKMTGKLIFSDHKPIAPQKHERILFCFIREGEVGYFTWSDVRRFGYLRVLATPAEIEHILEDYGPEPLISSTEDLVERLAHPSARTVKAVLLDQSVIAGIGNIYADEACFLAEIHPARRLKSLSPLERTTLVEAIQDILHRAVKQRGTSAHTYVDTDGKKGGFLRLLQVYGRRGKPCLRCETPITKSVLAGRGTHVCLTCQPLQTHRRAR